MTANVPEYSYIQLTEIDDEFRRDPHSRLDELRSKCPAMRVPSTNRIFITSYKDVRETLESKDHSRDWRNAESTDPARLAFEAINAYTAEEFGPHPPMAFRDHPDHTRVRKVIATAIQGQLPRARSLVEPVVEAALNRLDGSRAVDIVSEYSYHIPLKVVGELFAIPKESLGDFQEWSYSLFAAFNPVADDEQIRARIEAQLNLLRLFRNLADERRLRPGDDLMTDIVALQKNGAEISDDEIAHNALLVALGGHQTTTDFISSAVYYLLRNPDQLTAIQNDHGLWPSAIEEALRFAPPLTQLDRIATTAGNVRDCPFAPGDIIATSIFAANNDADVFHDPHSFDIRRKPNHHMSFGRGAHACPGAALGRLEGRTAVSKLFDRFPKLRLAEPDAAPNWRVTPSFRGLAHLQIAL
jgi:cytochrome P450